MDRIIEVKVFGNHLTKDSKNAGTRGEANVTNLRIIFDESWDKFEKKVVFWDAYGENAVRIYLTTNLLENIEKSTRIYLVPIPAEAMARSGKMSFEIIGSINDIKQASIPGELEVHDSKTILEPIPPTPDELSQIQGELEYIKSNIQDAVKAKEAIQNMNVSSETLSAGENVSVNKTVKDGVVNLHFCIPEGDKGADGKDGYTPVKGVDYYTDAETDEQIRAINEARDKAIGVIGDEKNKAFESIDEKKEKTFTNIRDASATVLNDINNSGADTLNNINAAYEEKKQEIKNVGEQVKSTIPDDYSKLTEKVNAAANAIKGTASGEIIRIDDISPIEHEMDVEVKSKNVFYIKDSKNTTSNGLSFNLVAGQSSFVVNGTSTMESAISITEIALKRGTYTISLHNANVTGAYTDRIYLRYTDASGNSVTVNYITTNTPRTFTTDTDITAMIYFVFSEKSTYENKEVCIQIVEGSVAKPYTPFVDVSGVNVSKLNILPYPYVYTTATINGITFTDNGDRSITVKGTALKDTRFLLQENAFYGSTMESGSRESATNGEYTISGKRILYSSATKQVLLMIYSGTTIDETIYPQIFVDVSTATISTFGKNLLRYPYKEKNITRNGITYTVNEDRSITVNGEAEGQSYFILNQKTNFPVGRKYILSGCPSGGSLKTYYMTGNGFSEVVADTGNGGKLEVATNSKQTNIVIVIESGYKANNLVFKPQIELEAATTYEPYIEPIEYSVSEDGTVEGVTSIAPTMTLICDKAGVIIEAEYNIDTNKAIENNNSHSIDDKGNAFFNADVKSVDSGGIVHSLNDTAKGIVNKSEGVDIYLPDSAEAPLKELSIDTKGATIYVTGNNLFNPKNISCRSPWVVDEYNGVKLVSGTTYNNDKGIIVIHQNNATTNDYFYILFDDVGVVQPNHGYTIIADVEVTKNLNTDTTSSTYNKIRFRTAKGLNSSSAVVDVRSGKIAAYIPADKFGENPDSPGIRILCLLWGKDMIFRNIILLPGDCRNNIPKYEDYRAQVITNVEDYKNYHTYYPTTRIINNADANMSVKYMADTKNYIDNKIAGLTALTLEG